MTMASGELTKASLTNLDKSGAQPIEFMFNPTQYSISKSNSWSAQPVVGSNVPRQEFTSGGAVSLSLELFFDTFESGEDVRDYTNKVFELTLISSGPKPQGEDVGRPPIVMFSWGKNFNFPAVIKSVSIQFIMFLPDGTPVRAKMSLTLEEAEDENEKGAQNPTTQGVIGNRVYIVKPGDTLDNIAYREYEDPNAWRHLADLNNLDNPKDLKPGQVLAIERR